MVNIKSSRIKASVLLSPRANDENDDSKSSKVILPKKVEQGMSATAVEMESVNNIMFGKLVEVNNTNHSVSSTSEDTQ